MPKRINVGNLPAKDDAANPGKGKRVVINHEEQYSVKKGRKGVVVNHEEQYSVKKDRKRK